MPSKNKAGACGCCGSPECTPDGKNYTTVNTSSTETMEGIVYNRYDMEQVSGDRIWATMSRTSYVLFEISNGDFYRIAYWPDGAGDKEIKIEKSTDSMATWTTEKTIFYDSAATSIIAFPMGDSICNDYRTGIKSSAGYDFIIDTTQDEFNNFFGYGETASGCYLGIGAGSADGFISDANWLSGSMAIDLWDTASNRGDTATEAFIELTGGETIVDVFGLSLSSSTAYYVWTRMTSYVGFSCTTDPDPNCGQFCPAAYPNWLLKVTDCSFTVSGTSISKTVNLATGFPATDGYPNFPILAGVVSTVSAADLLITLNNYITNSIPEWTTNGILRSYNQNNAQQASFNPQVCQNDSQWDSSYNAPMVSNWFGRGLRFLFSPPGWTTAAGGGGFVPEFTWTVGGAGPDYLTSFTAAQHSTYNGAPYDNTVLENENAELEVRVASETECNVTLECTVRDFTLYHGDPAVVAGRNPAWTAPLSVAQTGAANHATYTVDYAAGNCHNLPPFLFGNGGIGHAEITNYNTPTPFWDPGANVLTRHLSNASHPATPASGTEACYPAYDGGAAPFNFYQTTYTSLADAKWLRWEVVFQKTIAKADLPTTTTVNFTGSDVVSSNRPAGYETFIPYDTSTGVSIARQASATTIPALQNVNYPGNMCFMLQPNSGSVSLEALTESDWSASITLDPTPYI